MNRFADARCALPLFLAFLAASCGRDPDPADEQVAQGGVQVGCPLEALSAAQKASLGIRTVECRVSPDGDSRHDHSYAFGCYDCDGAVYDANEVLTNGNTLPKTPTSWTLRVPARWNKRLVMRVPQGPQTLAFPVPFLDVLLAEGYGVANVNHPEPFSPELTSGARPGYHPSAYADAYTDAGKRLRDTVGQLFQKVQFAYGFGFSRGMVSGIGLLLDRADSPFDGYVIGGGGTGRPALLELNDRIWRSISQRQPCPDDPDDPNDPRGTTISGLSQAAAETLQLTSIRIWDPSYTGPALGYDTTQSEAAAALAIRTDLQRPTVYLHGLLDGLGPPILGVKLIADIVRAGKGDLVRPYFFKTRAHGNGSPSPLAKPPISDEIFHDAVIALDRWVSQGEEPGPLREVIAADGTTQRTEAGCRARLHPTSWGASRCQESPYDFAAPELQAFPGPDDPRVASCPAWACFFDVQQGP